MPTRARAHSDILSFSLQEAENFDTFRDFFEFNPTASSMMF